MQRRMFSPKIVGSDAFLEMPTTSRELYFQLGMYADDDGFISPRKIMRMVGASDDDLKMLIAKRFVLPFQNGVIVIKHWRINNLIRKDYYQETEYTELKETLFLKENGAYTDNPQNGVPLIKKLCQQNVNNLLPQVRLGKDRIGKVSIGNKVAFTPPSLEEVSDYCKSRSNSINAEQFIDFYSSKGWMIGKNKMKDWRAAVRTWEKRSLNTNKITIL